MPFPEPDRLIVHKTHHKAGTVWFMGVLGRICRRFGWNFCTETKPPASGIWFNEKARPADFQRLQTEYVGSHMIRDPRDIVVSRYFYHLWCQEEWCLQPQKDLGGLSFQEKLQSLPQEDGIAFEIQTSKGEFQGMLNWYGSDPRILELKYETVILNQEEEFNRLFEHYGLTDEQINIAVRIAIQSSFQGRSKRPLGEEKRGVHLRKGMPGDWKNHFTKKHTDLFQRLYPDLLVRLGYVGKWHL